MRPRHVISGWVLSGLVLVAAVSIPQVVAAQEAAEVVFGKEPIPRNGFKTWSLFLVTNQDWLVPENNERLTDLYYRFRAFGRVIGDEHLAVWFWLEESELGSPQLWEAVDVERAVAYCGKIGIKPSRGPYILMTTEYPDETVEPTAFQWIELGNLNAGEINDLLKNLGDQLLEHGVVDDGALGQTPGSDDFWSAWFDATRRAIANVGASLRFEIHTPSLTITAKPPA